MADCSVTVLPRPTRRDFLRATSTAALVAGIPEWRRARLASLAALHPQVDPEAGPSDPMLRALALKAVDAARTAGAIYADVRFTADRTQTVAPKDTYGLVTEEGTVSVAVRALVGGGWGFATAPDCTEDSVVRLARQATAQAAIPRWPTGTPIQLDDHPPTQTGTWTTSVARDPFLVSVDEKVDWLQNCLGASERLGMHDVSLSAQLVFRRQEKVFASMTGAYVTQTLFWVGPLDLDVEVTDPATQAKQSVTVPIVPLQSGGYEVLSAVQPDDHLDGWVDEVWRQTRKMPVPIGQVALVLDAHTTAALVRSTVGYATEWDRVRGDDVNATGTSYLSAATLGQSVAASSVTVTGSRSHPHGPAQAGWDDEGVASESFPLIDRGVLVDFATSRADATQLRPWYTSRQQVVRSHGCAVADTAADRPLVMPPDLMMTPGTGTAGFADLVAGVGRGVAVVRGECDLDREQRAGQGMGTMYEIRNGRLGRMLNPGATFLFRSADIWHHLLSLGGTESTMLRGFRSSKGEPEQTASHGVWAVPIALRDVVLIDVGR